MSDDRTIRGEATLTWIDHGRSFLRPAIRFMIVFGLLMAVMFAAIWALTLGDEAWLDLRHDPFGSLRGFVEDAWPFYATTFGVLLAVIVGLQVRAFRRFPDVNRRLSYEANSFGLTTRDAANFASPSPGRR